MMSRYASLRVKVAFNQDGLPLRAFSQAVRASVSHPKVCVERCQRRFSHSCWVFFTCFSICCCVACSWACVRTITQRSFPCGNSIVRTTYSPEPSESACHCPSTSSNAVFALVEVSGTRLIHQTLASL